MTQGPHSPAMRLAGDDRGATLIEFALIAPVLCLLLLCAFDMAHTLYVQTVLQGAVQKAGRDSSLEDGADPTVQAAIDAIVTQQVKALNADVNPTFDRKAYQTFAAASAKAEPWTDTDKDGKCDNGEPYEDDNGNGVWDSDVGAAGQGGAKDRTVYTVTLRYPHLFPIYGFIGGSNYVNLSATTILENQPYADQVLFDTPKIGNCP